MYSIRVEPGDLKDPRSNHVMYQADKVMVHHEPDGHSVQLTLRTESSEGNKFEHVTVVDDQVAYLMNEQGVTVDAIRTKASKQGRKKQ